MAVHRDSAQILIAEENPAGRAACSPVRACDPAQRQARNAANFGLADPNNRNRAWHQADRSLFPL